MPAKLSTHVLDITRGCPARDVQIELWSLAGETRELLKTVRTNAEGRTDQPLLAADGMRAGRYELVFYVGDYFAGKGSSRPQVPFLDRVPVQFGIADATASYHVPLLVSPWAYSTYRGELSGSSMKDLAATTMERIDALGRISDEAGCLTRTFCSPAMRRVNGLVASWMRAAGMAVREDAIGNLIGHYPASTRHGRILLLGSHLDTVRNAGRFDGPLGVILAIACVEHLRQNHLRLPFAIEVCGFADEEGIRYQCAYLGSRAAAGLLADKDLRRKDGRGVSMADAIRSFGGQPARLKQARFDAGRLLGYVEAHIEQGPVLEERKAAVGIVTAIAGQSRFKFAFTGRAGHAGTTPIRLRRDALCAAAEFILAAEDYAARKAGLVATVGQIQVEPNSSNVIPGAATLTLEVRHQTDSVRRIAGSQFQKLARQIAATRRVKVSAQLVQQTPSVACSPKLSGLLERATRRHEPQIVRLPSGAGHDAAILAGITPTAMLFIRCKGGISHHPDESASRQDVRVALAVLNDFVRLLASEYGRL